MVIISILNEYIYIQPDKEKDSDYEETTSRKRKRKKKGRQSSPTDKKAKKTNERRNIR